MSAGNASAGGKRGGTGPSGKAETRQAREAEALRQNLRRRKAQMRARAGKGPEDAEDTDEPRKGTDEPA